MLEFTIEEVELLLKTVEDNKCFHDYGDIDLLDSVQNKLKKIKMKQIRLEEIAKDYFERKLREKEIDLLRK